MKMKMPYFSSLILLLLVKKKKFLLSFITFAWSLMKKSLNVKSLESIKMAPKPMIYIKISDKCHVFFLYHCISYAGQCLKSKAMHMLCHWTIYNLVHANYTLKQKPQLKQQDYSKEILSMRIRVGWKHQLITEKLFFHNQKFMYPTWRKLGGRPLHWPWIKGKVVLQAL